MLLVSAYDSELKELFSLQVNPSLISINGLLGLGFVIFPSE